MFMLCKCRCESDPLERLHPVPLATDSHHEDQHGRVEKAREEEEGRSCGGRESLKAENLYDVDMTGFQGCDCSNIRRRSLWKILGNQ